MNPISVVVEHRLRLESRCLPIFPSNVSDDVFEPLQVVRGYEQGIEFNVDFMLSRSNFMVLCFDGDPHLFEFENHFRTNIPVLIKGCRGKVTQFMAVLICFVPPGSSVPVFHGHSGESIA